MKKRMKNITVENNYIINIKIMNKIQCTKIQKNHVVLPYIYIFCGDK